MTRKALRILRRAGPNAYDGAVSALRDDTREWWQELLEDGPEENGEANGEEEGRGPYEPTAASLRTFLEEEMLPSLTRRGAPRSPAAPWSASTPWRPLQRTPISTASAATRPTWIAS